MKPSVLDALPAVKALKDKSGCCLHAVLDDGNVKDSHVTYCRDVAATQGHQACQDLANLMLSMSKTQRLKLSALMYR